MPKRVAVYILFVLAGALAVAGALAMSRPDGHERHLLYVAVPGVRNYVEHGGVGILVFDMDDGHRFVKRIPTFQSRDGEEPEAIKGIAASGQTGRLYFTTTKRLVALDLKTEKTLWNREYEGG